ncbi:MAG: UDP-N-acetylglucosamine 1-carboxyvinyltransferase [Alphaproteobacteria bacterium]|nr:UDP-N-acetylglucosamine 1-carboxyvinyltransferase [Alphaproteobacteria bacterium]
MDKIRIIGGNTLSGRIRVKGAKNAVLPLMAASLLTEEEVILHDVPNLSDIRTMTKVLEHLGAQVSFEGDTLRIKANNINCFEAPYELVSKMRASFWVLGPLVARFHQARVSLPGGCAIGTRPVDRHLYAMEQLGIKIDIEGGYVLASGKPQGNKIYFQIKTVGGTMNALMASVLANGTTEIINAAAEPEVTDLAKCLVKMGANIDGIGTSHLIINGVEKLHGVSHTVIPDRIEAATYAIAAGITGGQLYIENARLDLIENIAFSLNLMGLNISQKNDCLFVKASSNRLKATDIATEEFPGFPTDVQAQIMALMCLAEGTSTVTENIFENRFMHVQELVRMGADIRLQGSRTAIIKGVDQLSGAQVMASDLRASAALVLAGLAAKGETIVNRIYHLDRGYDHMEEKLRSCGANIERIKEKIDE